MTKEQIIKLYIADLNNLVAYSDAKRNRIMDLEDELEALKQGQSLPIDSVSQRYTIEDIERCVENWGLCKVEKEYIEKFLNGG